MPPEQPTQIGPQGLRYDFNDGCRLACPEGDGDWKVSLLDLDTGNILFQTKFQAGRVNSTARYFVRFRIEVSQNEKVVFEHDYNAANQDVLIRFPVDTLGDVLGWFPYAVKFKERHNCRLTCAMEARLITLFRDAYPDITFITHEQVQPERFYATYTIAVFFKQGAIFDHKNYVPCDFRFVGLHRAAGYILGVDPTEVRPRIALIDDSRPIADPYVCIAVQSTLQAKYWNNPNGWREIVAFLKASGYRVICIDQKARHGKGDVWTQMPAGAEDNTGDKPLVERARYLKHAEFFVGLSSGLSWLAWAMETPVVMISGLTHPLNEFENPYRVVNYHVCNSCWNDPKQSFNRDDFLSCPKHQNTTRQFECTRLITIEQVKAAIRAIPAYIEHAKTHPEALAEQKTVTYNPAVFDVPDMAAAKHIILTPEGSTTELRWKVETPYVADLIGQSIPITPDTVLIDYGCGIGRMAKELIDRHQCSVVGVDISEKMRALASQYVNSERFKACSPEELDAMITEGKRFDAGISIWVLQHCLKPSEDIARIKLSLKKDARIFILNNIWRAVPTVEQFWTVDDIDIKTLLTKQFSLTREGVLPPDKTTESLSRVHFWAAFSNR